LASYARPHSIDEALDYLRGGDVTILAGGTDFYPAMVDRVIDRKILDTSLLKAPGGISSDDKYWRLGGGATWTDVINADLPAAFDGLKQSARQVGSVQIQNVATVAGNLCNASPAADGVPPLLVLDAQVELSSASGVRTLPLSRFILGNRQTERKADELLSAILIPTDADAARSSFLKLGARDYLVISIVSVAALVEVSAAGEIARARVAIGACSEVPCRLPALEADLVGHKMAEIDTAFVSEQHLTPLSPIDDVRGSAAYRLDVVREMIRRALIDCQGQPA
jgi:CO/xanthine dehydrogenase FAD-binding subunit